MNAIQTVLVSCILTSAVFSQEKQQLDHDAFDIWNRITEPHISKNGRWMMFSTAPEEGDSQLQILRTSGEDTLKVERGKSAAFSIDSQFAVSLIKAPRDSVRQAKRDKVAEHLLPQDSLAIIDLRGGRINRVPRIKSFKMPEKAGNWLAYLHARPAEKDSTDETVNEDSTSTKGRESQGTELVFHPLNSGTERRFDFVTEYLCAENGKWLIFVKASKDSTADGLFAYDPQKNRLLEIVKQKGDYKQITADTAGTQIAFLSNYETIDKEKPDYRLYLWRADRQILRQMAGPETAGMPSGWQVSEHGKVAFSKSGRRLMFGIAPEPAPKQPEIPEDERVDVDIWHWQDPYTQPMQLKQVDKENKRSYLAVIYPKGKQIIQLGKEEIPDIQIASEGDADIAVGVSHLPYRQEISWDYPEYYDVYLMDVKTGKQRLIKKRLQSRPRLSPGGDYLTWWDRSDSSWYTISTKKGAAIKLTASMQVPLYNELHDEVYQPNSYGSAGWTEEDRHFLVYDKYDIWALDPTGKQQPVCLTDGHGRHKGIRFRYIRLEREQRFIPADKRLLLSAYDYQTRASGFYTEELGGSSKPRKLVLDDYHYSRPVKADSADLLLFTRENFQTFPDLWVSDLDLEDSRQLTNVNPQQKEYKWGAAELYSWASMDGQIVDGLLFKPEDFDELKKYPMLVYFYEKNSELLNRHRPPEAHRSIINITFYVSRGYVVFMPDVHYQVGYPGQSALNCILPGVTALIEKGFIDPDNIGVQGHSWGGYQIAYLVTRTNIFKAAEAGAPVSNMTSAYGGVRWETGRSRMFQYERTQSRIGGSLWEFPMRYMENSPIFWLDKVETPLLIMHNDKDGHVPWYQGIELFLALRRLGKPAWMINYNNEPHWPVPFHKKKDWQIRMQQYFDHYLKGTPAPKWLTEGLPAIKKGQSLGTELPPETHGNPDQNKLYQ